MKLARLSHDPAALLDFFNDGLSSLGAVCERSWHDRLQLVAEGPPATLFQPDGALIERELHFLPAEHTGPRQAGTEVFPGCPLTFHLAELLRPVPLPLERAVLKPFDQGKPPAPEMAEKLWHAQQPGASRWRMDAPFRAAWSCSLVVLACCEIQAMDQHWSLHRLALSLFDGERDEGLASQFSFAEIDAAPTEPVPWPEPDLPAWQARLTRVLEEEVTGELAPIRERQANYLRRELDRVDDYFENYERELTERQGRTSAETSKAKWAERLAAARAEHARRRHDQVQRHALRVVPHVHALLLVAEPAWAARLAVTRHGQTRGVEAMLVPRARRWLVKDG